jgi:uncharacterized protein involved in type VI secretion and phage assembly
MIFDETEETAAEISGVVVGEVTDINDPEDLGRVKIRFPWRDVDDESYWARMTTPMAGPETGMYFIPEKGDEVLVSFARGEQRFPYVLGALWNTNQKPPKQSDPDNNIRMIRSRSGHELVLNDADGEAKVEIVTNGGHTVVLDDKSGSEKITIEDKSGQNTIEFDAAGGTLTIEGGTKLELKATNIDIQGNGNVTLEASGILELKGSMIKLN